MGIGDKVSEKVVNKLAQRIDKELTNALNKEEELGSYLKRTMYGKLGKKMAIKELKKEGIEEEGSKDITDEDLYKQTLGGSQKNKNILYLVLAINTITYLMLLTIYTVILGVEGNEIYIGIILFTGILSTITLTNIFKNKSKRDSVEDENIQLKYNKVYKYEDEYLRYYEIKGYPYIEEYLRGNKLKPISYKEIMGKEGIKISPILTEKEIIKFDKIFQ